MIQTEQVPVSVSLAYRLSDIKLFSTELSGVAMRRHFTRLQPFSEFPAAAEVDGRSADFTFYPCYPVAFEPPPIHAEGGFLWYTPYTFDNSYIDFREIADFDAYLQRMSSKSRSTLRRKIRKFEQAGGGQLDWRVYSDAEAMPEFYEQALEVSLKTYQERLLGCGLPRHAGYLEELKSRCAGGGAIGYLLFLNGRAVAYELSYVEDGVVGYDYVGFDPEYGKLSAGTVLMYLLIEDLFGRPGVEIFDFTEGESQHKSVFGSHQTHCAKTYVLRDTLGNRARVGLHHRLDGFATRVGALLERSGLKSRIKRWLRR